MALKIINDWISNVLKGRQIESSLLGKIRQATGKDIGDPMPHDGTDRWRDDL